MAQNLARIPSEGHAKLDVFLAPFSSLPFDDGCARKCAQIRRALERTGERIGPHASCEHRPLDDVWTISGQRFAEYQATPGFHPSYIGEFVVL